MRRVVWTLTAREDLRRIRDYILQFNPLAADRVTTALVDAADSLQHFADRGRPSAAALRELVAVWPYIIRYRIADDAVFVIRVRHGAQMPGSPGRR